MNGDDSTGGERASGYRHTPLEETKARRWYCNGERQQQRTVISRCVGKTMPYLPDPTETDRCIRHATEESPGHVHIRELSAPKQSDCGRRCLPGGRCSIDYYYYYYCRKAKTEAVALAWPRADSGQGSEGRLSIRAPYSTCASTQRPCNSRQTMSCACRLEMKKGTSASAQPRESFSRLSVDLSEASSSCHGMAWHSVSVRSSA